MGISKVTLDSLSESRGPPVSPIGGFQLYYPSLRIGTCYEMECIFILILLVPMSIQNCTVQTRVVQPSCTRRPQRNNPESSRAADLNVEKNICVGPKRKIRT